MRYEKSARRRFWYLERRLDMTAFGSAIMRRFSIVLLFGSAGNRNRTYDLIITNDALYQLSYSGAGRDFKALAGSGQFKTSIHQHQTQFLG